VGDAELTKDIFEALKPGSDLCDGEIINFSYRGYCDENTQRRCPVIGITGITRDRDVKKIKNRMSVMKQTFIELQRDVEGWNIANEPAEIFSLTIINKKIINIERTPY